MCCFFLRGKNFWHRVVPIRYCLLLTILYLPAFIFSFFFNNRITIRCNCCECNDLRPASSKLQWFLISWHKYTILLLENRSKLLFSQKLENVLHHLYAKPPRTTGIQFHLPLCYGEKRIRLSGWMRECMVLSFPLMHSTPYAYCLFVFSIDVLCETWLLVISICLKIYS